MEYPLVCAGTEYLGDNSSKQLKKDRIKKSIYSHTFMDKSGKPIKTSEYLAFVVKGWSMMLADILNGDLILCKKGFNPDTILNNRILPGIYVIRCKKKPEQNINYKLRRGWCIIRVLSSHKNNEQDYFTQVLETIMSSESFANLRTRATESMVVMPTNEELIRDFFDNRLTKYKEDYLSDEQYLPEHDSILISTTLHTDENTIKFSIHPVSSIVGKMDLCYRMSEQTEYAA